MTEISLIEVYKIVDSFFKYFEGNFLVEHFARNYYGKRGFKRYLSMKDIMSLNIYRFFMQFSNLKAFHRFANEYLKERYPNFPNYENFLKATNKSFPMMMMFVNSVLAKNREKCAGETIHFIDSTPVEVCKNNKISRHKVAKDCASRGKSTKGWFFGFKLHGICTADMIVESLTFTTGSVHDSKMAQKLTKDIIGKAFADAGYQLKSEVLSEMADDGVFMHNATRKNMNRLISKEQLDCLKQRNIIETVWSVMKGRFELVYTKARSLKGMFRHFFYSIAAFLISQSACRQKLFIPD